jgi:polyvinyl alcohol dehydrogenase (cytochrome)
MRGKAALGIVVLVSCRAGSGAPPSTAPDSDAGADATTPHVPLDCGGDGASWSSFGQNVCNTRATTSAGALSKSTASRLAVKWTLTVAGDVSATPAIEGGSVYVPDWSGSIQRIDAATGAVTWSKGVGEAAAFVADGGAPLPGLVSRTSPLVTADSVIFGTQRDIPFLVTDPRPSARVVALDKATGATRWTRALDDGHVAAVITASPVLDGDRVYVGVSSLEEAFAQSPSYVCCTFRGSVAALDRATGALLWQTHTISDALYYKGDGVTPSGYAGVAVWSSHGAVDRKRKSLYVTTGNDYAVPSGVTAVEPGNNVGSILALDLDTGAIKWARPLVGLDVYTFKASGGNDYDFGAGANLFTANVNGAPRDLVGAGQKSGVYTALDADTGEIVWQTKVGPGGHFGGIHWGTATDGERIYVGVNNEKGADFTLAGSGPHAGETIHVGAWSALDPATGAILWQVPNAASASVKNGTNVNGPVTVVNGVVFGGSMDDGGTMLALDAATGDVLWTFASGGTVYGGAAVVNGLVVWGSGYSSMRLGFGTESRKLYAFEVK